MIQTHFFWMGWGVWVYLLYCENIYENHEMQASSEMLTFLTCFAFMNSEFSIL